MKSFVPPLCICDDKLVEVWLALCSVRSGRKGTLHVHGGTWSILPFAGFDLAVSSEGPNAIFDSDVGGQYLDANHCARSLKEAWQMARFGPILGRVACAIHVAAIRQQRSWLTIADCHLGQFVWGHEPSDWPSGWRREIARSLTSLANLHLIVEGRTTRGDLGASTTLLTGWADIEGRPAHDSCTPDCLYSGAGRHRHFELDLGPAFLGRLEECALWSGDARSYDFGSKPAGDSVSAMRKIATEGALKSIFLPVLVGSHARSLPVRQKRLLQVLVSEATRKHSIRALEHAGEAFEVVHDAKVPGSRRSEIMLCPLLQPDLEYVAFNGNRVRKGMGYKVTTAGGWLHKAKYDEAGAGLFFQDLHAMADLLGVVTVGYIPGGEFMPLAELRRRAASSAWRTRLEQVHVRIYAPMDFVAKASSILGYVTAKDRGDAASDLCGDLKLYIAAYKSTQSEAAALLNVDQSFLSKVMRGKRPLSHALATKIKSLCAQPLAVKDSTDRLTGPNSGWVSIAHDYLRIGWSVVPQHSGKKHPCVKWKEFQENLPTAEQVIDWATRFAQAGWAAVLGPVSNLLVVDVDGRDAHDELLRRLGTSPVTPTVSSGSGDPFRYHLYFMHPQLVTKAKVTPWHSKLEFRGKGGVIVLPPSTHPSGRTYQWRERLSPMDVPVAPLPDEILSALKESNSTFRPPAAAEELSGVEVSRSTAIFLSGKLAHAPNWNNLLFRVACDLKARGVGLEVAMRVLLRAAAPTDLSNESIARKTIASAFDRPREPSVY